MYCGTVRCTRSKLWGINKKTAPAPATRPRNVREIVQILLAIGDFIIQFRVIVSVSFLTWDLTDHSSDTRPSSGIHFWKINIISWKRHNHHAVPHEYLLYPFIKPGKRSVHFGMMSCEPEQTLLYHSVRWSTQESVAGGTIMIISQTSPTLHPS